MEKFVVVVFVFAALVLSNVAFAADVDLFLSDQEINIFTGTSKSVELTVKNNQAARDTFSISVFPSLINKVSNFPSPERVVVDSGANGTSKISFSAFLDALESQIFFNISAKSLNSPNVIASRLIQVSVKRTVPIFISELKISKDVVNPGDSIIISVGVTNGGGLTSDRYMLETVVKKGGSVVKTFTNDVEGMPPTSVKQINNTYAFGKYGAPGDYVIVAMLKDLSGKQISTSEDLQRVSVKVREVPSTTISDKSTQLGILNIKVTVTVKNQGNVPAKDFYVTESIPFIARELFEPAVKPDTTKTEGASIVYGWFVQSLQPGSEFTVTYQFSLWKVWSALVVIVGSIIIAFKYVFTVAVVKRATHAGAIAKGREIVAHVEVKNRSLNEVKDVAIRDSVPSHFEVVERFGTLRPAVKRTNTGTAIIWKLDSLRGGEERVMSYAFKPRMDIAGAVRLPLASVMFTTKKHQTKTSYSNRAVIGSGR